MMVSEQMRKGPVCLGNFTNDAQDGEPGSPLPTIGFGDLGGGQAAFLQQPDLLERFAAPFVSIDRIEVKCRAQLGSLCQERISNIIFERHIASTQHPAPVLLAGLHVAEGQSMARASPGI